MSGRGIYERQGCIQPKHNAFNPQPHQIEAMNYFFTNPEKRKGMLLYHRVGSGKTCTAIMIADRAMQEGVVNKVFVLSPGSLREVWQTEYCKVCGDLNMKENFVFVTYNFGIDVSRLDFTGSLVIIDEAHNFIASTRNRSKICSALYDKLMESNCRILLLTGTPLFNSVGDPLVMCRLINPRIPDLLYRGTKKNAETGLEEDDMYEKDILHLRQLFNLAEEDEQIMDFSNPTIGMYFSGIISYFPGNDDKDLPTVVVPEPFRVPSSDYQFGRYAEIARVEQILRVAGEANEKNLIPHFMDGASLRIARVIARRYMMTLSASNFILAPFPESDEMYAHRATDTKNLKLPTTQTKGKMNEEDMLKLLTDRKSAYPDELVKNGGWISREALKGGYLWKASPKLATLLYNIILHPNEKHVVYTMFKTYSGAKLIKNILALAKIESFIFSGDLSGEDRLSVLTQFNADYNIHGEYHPVLIFTDAGAEGITLKAVRHLHLFESSTKEMKVRQVIGRVVRYKSHDQLPIEERQVTIWKYWTVYPEGSVAGGPPLVDEALYNRGLKQAILFNSLLKVLQAYSVT